MTNQMLVPGEWRGSPEEFPAVKGYEWIAKLPTNKKIYLSMWSAWHSSDLPADYDYYIVSYHLEAVNLPWLQQQAAQINKPIIVLFDGNSYDTVIPNVHFIPYYYWHEQLEQLIRWFGIKEKHIPEYKFSAVCNRVTQSKVWTTTKLLETARATSLIVLNSWLDEKNVHSWQPTGNSKLDQLSTVFQNKYQGKTIKIDDFDNDSMNQQRITGNPWQPLIDNVAINFTNESFHYSLMMDPDRYIWPGPFLTEKTLKCLVGGTTFIPVGQFETYHTLSQLGLEFDYGFDISWDTDPGNLSRAASIIDLIDHLNQYDITKLVELTQASSKFNQNWIVTGQFAQQCQRRNQESTEKIFEIIG